MATASDQNDMLLPRKNELSLKRISYARSTFLRNDMIFRLMPSMTDVRLARGISRCALAQSLRILMVAVIIPFMPPLFRLAKRPSAKSA
jgi:hypothetical protein